MKNNFYSFEKKTETSADLYIYGDITSYEWDESDVSAFGFKQDLDNLGDVLEINVHINSLGGSTFQGLAIYNLLKQHKATINTYIDGIAASSASIIAMAGDKIFMPKTSLMMIHNCYTYTMGNAKELRKTAEDMDKIAIAYKEAYLSKINISEEELNKLLDEETYLTADECVEKGFADEIIKSQENTEINQYASIFNLVKKLKEKDKQEKMQFNENDIDKLAEKISNKLISSKSKLQNNSKDNNQIKEDAWASFFNTKIIKKEGKKI